MCLPLEGGNGSVTLAVHPADWTYSGEDGDGGQYLRKEPQTLTVHVFGAKDLMAKDKGGTSDPYATIRYGRRRMPSYQRIDENSRWDIVNYVRYLNGQEGVAAK